MRDGRQPIPHVICITIIMIPRENMFIKLSYELLGKR